MALDINKVVEDWERDEPNFKNLGEAVFLYIKQHITDYEIFPEISQRTKELLSIIKKIKKKNKQKPYSYDDLKDKLGIRIICSYQEDLDTIDSFLKTHFQVLKSEYKKDYLDFDKLDYTSNHYDVKVKMDTYEFKDHLEYVDLVFEIQVRTLNQHAWSNTAHSLAYKQETDISVYLKRRIYRLLSLYEIADDEFSSVNLALTDNSDSLAYKLLRKLESKVYKYAKTDFDRSSSLTTIKIILTFLTEEQQRILVSGIDTFMNEKSQDLEQVFWDNKFRFHEIDIITQPEIFVIWYCLDHFYFEITDNWADYFDQNDLEQAAVLWGRSLD